MLKVWSEEFLSVSMMDVNLSLSLCFRILSHLLPKKWRDKAHTSTWKLNGNVLISQMSWCHFYCVFTLIHSLLIEKDICDCQNFSVKLPCVCMCLLSGDLFIFWVRDSSFFSCFLFYPYFGTFLSMWFHICFYVSNVFRQWQIFVFRLLQNWIQSSLRFTVKRWEGRTTRAAWSTLSTL